MPLASGSLLSHYEIRSKIGAGGMGEVYLAHDTKLGRDVALKILPEDLAQNSHRLQRFVQEARAASVINHPNVCTIHEVGSSDEGRSFIAMEYIEGETLADKIQRSPLPSLEIIDLGIQIASALEEAHAKGIIHRDIKPRNIAVTRRGQVKVLDFGLAHVVPQQKHLPIEQASTVARTDTGILLGTIDYMSPEQALGREIDARTDIFSLGVVLYEMATGRKPFSTDNKLETIDRIAHAQPEPVSRVNRQISRELQHVISRCLEKEPKRRFQSAADLVAALSSLKQERHPRFRRGLTVALGMTTLALLLLWILSVRQSVHKELSAVKLPEKKFLVVLPFHVVGEDPAAKSFADGLFETTTSKLSLLDQFHGLFVVPAAEVRDREVTSIGKAHAAFGVTLVISGSVQRERDRIRLTVNLNNAESMQQLWSTVDDYLLSNVTALQDGIVLKVAKALGLKVEPGMRGLIVAGQTSVPSAYDFYLQGRGYLQRYDKPESVDGAISLFERALKDDSRYALAYAGLGEAYWQKYKHTMDTRWVEDAKRNCNRAIKLEKRLAPVYVSLGIIHTGTGRYSEAIRLFDEALQLDPRNPDAYRELAKTYQASGSIAQAEDTYKKAIDLWRNYWSGYSHLGALYHQQGRYLEAAEQFERVIELTPDNYRGYYNLGVVYFHLERWQASQQMYEKSLALKSNYGAYTNLATLLFYDGKYLEAAGTYEKALQLKSQDYRVRGYLAGAQHWAPGKRHEARMNYQKSVEMAEAHRKINPKDNEVLSNLAGYYAILNERRKALSLVRKLETLSSRDAEVTFHIGLVHEQLGGREQALKWIAVALENGYSRKEIERNPFLQELRTDPRFKALSERSRSTL